MAVDEDVDRAVEAAREAFEEGPWPQTSPEARAELLQRVADLLRQRSADIASVTTEEMGCAMSQSPQAQTGTVAPVFEYYSSLIRSFEFDRHVVSGERAALVTSMPVGVVAAIVPWNAPVTLASWKVAPALAAGCTVVLKPPPEAPLSNFILAEAVEQAGLPPGVLNVVPAGREVGEHLVTHPGTEKIAFTGSTAAGKRIMALCADRIKRVSLELGGKSAAIVLDDADIGTVLPRIVWRDAPFRPGLWSTHPHSGPAGQVRRGNRRGSVSRSSGHGGRPPRPLDARWPAGRRAPEDPGGGLHRARHRRRGSRGGRRRAAGEPPQRVVRRTHDPRRRRKLVAGGPGGDLRAGALRHLLRGRRRPGAPGQRVAVRSGRRRLVRRPGTRGSKSPGGYEPAAWP